MKNLFLTLTLCLFSTIAAAQPVTTLKSARPTPYNFGFGIEAHWLILGGLGLKFDTRLSESVALEVGGYYIPPRENIVREEDKVTSRETNYLWSSYEVFIGPRIMVTGDYSHHGMFITPALGYTGANITDYGDEKLSASLNVPEARIAVGYQFVVKNFRFLTGAGWRVMGSSDIIVKDKNGDEVYSTKSNSLSGLVLDAHAAILF